MFLKEANKPPMEDSEIPLVFNVIRKVKAQF